MLELRSGGTCTVSNLTRTAETSGLEIVSAGFVKLKCLGVDTAVELLDESGAPARCVGVSAKRLFADYKANEISADIQYRGKSLRVTGKVSQIGKDVLDKPYLSLGTSNEYESVVASFADESPLVALRKGQQVSVRCTGKGMHLGSPVLAGCVLQ